MKNRIILPAKRIINDESRNYGEGDRCIAIKDMVSEAREGLLLHSFQVWTSAKFYNRMKEKTGMMTSLFLRPDVIFLFVVIFTLNI